MIRGDIVIVREPGTPASKARPCLVVQHSSTIAVSRKITVCALTSYLSGRRPVIVPSNGNGLRRMSEVEIDWIFTHPRSFIGDRVGKVEDECLAEVFNALRCWLDL